MRSTPSNYHLQLKLAHWLTLQGAELGTGVKYILRTEIIFERVATPLTPETAASEDWAAWQQIEHLYDSSQVSVAVGAFFKQQFQ